MRMFWELTSGSGEMSVVYNKLRKFSKADKTVVEKRKASDEIFTADSHKHTKIG